MNTKMLPSKTHHNPSISKKYTTQTILDKFKTKQHVKYLTYPY